MTLAVAAQISQPTGASFSSVVNDVANVATIGLATAALLVFLLSRDWSIRLLLARNYASSIGRTTPGFGRRSLSRLAQFNAAVGERLGGSTETIADEYRLLSALCEESKRPLGWKEPSIFAPLADAYRLAAARITRSFTLRLAGPELGKEEAQRAETVAKRLALDASYGVVEPDLSFELTPLLKALGTVFLVPPPSGAKSAYDDVRVTLTGNHFGAPQRTFQQLLSDPAAGNWGSVDASISQALDRRVNLVAQERAASGIDFNGLLLRAQAWRVERSMTALHTRLHILGETTNFASAVATNTGLANPLFSSETGIDVRELCIGGPGTSHAADALAVHLAVISSDKRLLLTRRSHSVEWGKNLLNTAANGVVELGPRQGLERGDLDADGFVDLIQAAIREAHEEIGSHLEIRRDSVVVRALALDRGPDQVTPYAILEARVPMSFEEIVNGHFANMSRTEGSFEIGGELIGVSLKGEDPTPMVHWIRARRDTITRSGIAGVDPLSLTP